MKPLTEEQLKQIAKRGHNAGQPTDAGRGAQTKGHSNRQRKSRAKQREEKLQERQSKEAEAARAAGTGDVDLPVARLQSLEASDQELEQLKERHRNDPRHARLEKNENIAGTYNPLQRN